MPTRAPLLTTNTTPKMPAASDFSDYDMKKSEVWFLEGKGLLREVWDSIVTNSQETQEHGTQTNLAREKTSDNKILLDNSSQPNPASLTFTTLLHHKSQTSTHLSQRNCGPHRRCYQKWEYGAMERGDRHYAISFGVIANRDRSLWEAEADYIPSLTPPTWPAPLSNLIHPNGDHQTSSMPSAFNYPQHSFSRAQITVYKAHLWSASSKKLRKHPELSAHGLVVNTSR
jgi:hypothetical protein